MNSILHLLLQANEAATEARLLFKDEKINTVIAVILLVWLGIGAYLILTGRKLRKLEKEVQEMGKNRNLGGAGEVEEKRIEVKRNES